MIGEDKDSKGKTPALFPHIPDSNKKIKLEGGLGGLFRRHMEVSDYVISTLDEFFTMAGFEIYSEEGEEVHLKVKSTNKLIKVRRDLFMKYVTPESSVIEEEDIEDMEDEQYNIMVKTASAGLKEITNARRKASSKEIKGGGNILLTFRF